MAMKPTYADIARSRAMDNDSDQGPLGYSVNRANSTGLNAISAIKFTESSPQNSVEQEVKWTHHPSPATLSPGSPHTRRPSLEPRRLSIAQVLSKVSSRSSSYFSDTPSESSNFTQLPKLHGYEDPVLSPVPRRKRPKKRRRRSSQTRDHADFIASRGRPPELRSRVSAPQGPLLDAILDGNIERVRSLTAHKSSIEDNPDHRPLQVASLKGVQRIVELLLDSGHFNINARDSKERTALFAAASRGHESIVNILLRRGARPMSVQESQIANLELERYRAYEAQISHDDQASIHSPQSINGGSLTAEPEEDPTAMSLSNKSDHPAREDSSDDHLSKLEKGSCENIKEMEEVANQKRQDAQKKGDWVRGPMTPSRLPSPLSQTPLFHKHARYPGFGFSAPVVEFDFTGNGRHRVIYPTPTVDQLLYGTQGVDTIVKGRSPSSHDTCRWYHLPANHLGWAEDLIRKIYEKRSADEQKKRDVILQREPFCDGEYDHTNSALLNPSPQARSLRPLCRNMTLDRDGAQRLSSALALHVPYIHWETEENRAEMHHVMGEVREARKYDIDYGSQKIPGMKTIEEHSAWSKDQKLLCAYLYNNPPVHPRRTLDQFYYHMLEDTERRDKDQVITRYYHSVWKRNHNLPEEDAELEFSSADEEEHNHQFSLNIQGKENKSSIDLSKSRTGGTQVDSPSTVGHQHRLETVKTNVDSRVQTPPDDIEKSEVKHVMMVDQLWLWILDKNTIITCFPHAWGQEGRTGNKEANAIDVLKNIHSYLALVNRPPLESVHDLAQLIVYNCLAPFCKKSTPYGPMQILDVYDSAIASVTDKESLIFNQFAIESKAQHEKDNSSKDSGYHHEQLYNIDQEIEQLKEIKDIQDELHILSVLLENQTTVLKEAMVLLSPSIELVEEKSKLVTPPRKNGANQTSQIAPYSSEKDFQKLYLMVLEREKRLKGLEAQAEQANTALNHLLDLKQKQANVSEARSARLTAESTKQQGNIMVLFTLVTIIFAPLSLMSTMFSLRVVEFPDQLHMNYVLKYMFAVSVSVIVPLLGLVIYTTRITIRKLIRRLEKRVVNMRWLQEMKWKRKKKEIKEKWKGTGMDSVSSTADAADVDHIIWRTGLWGQKKKVVKQEIIDTEKGLRIESVKEVG